MEQLVLGHELLLLARSRCCWKWGSWLLHRPYPLDRLPSVHLWNPGVRSASDRHHPAGAPGMGSVWQYYGAGRNTTTFRIRNLQPDHRTSIGQSIQGITNMLPSAYIHLLWCGGSKGRASRPRLQETYQTPVLYDDMRDVREEFSGVILCPKRTTKCDGKRSNVWHQCALSESKHPRNEMDEGMPTFLPWHAIRLLVAIKTINGWRGRVYLSTGLQTFVCVALVFSCRPSHISSAHLHWGTSDIGCMKVTEEDEKQLWIEAYMCALQCMAEAYCGLGDGSHEGRD